MLPLTARSPRSGQGDVSAQGRLLIVGMVISLASAGLGYAAHGDPVQAARAGQESSLGTAGGGSTATGAAGAGATGGGGGALTGLPGSVASVGGRDVPVGGAPRQGAGGTTTSPAGAGPGRPGTSAGAGDAGCGQLTCGPRTASDQGVTAEAIKLGFLIPNTDQLAQAGFNVGVGGDDPKIINAWVNEINRLKVNGRTVSVVSQVFSVLDAQDQQAACKTMTQDQKVFAVITPGGYDSVAQLCIAKENRTPLISTDPEPAQWYKDANPMLWSLFMNKDRIARNNAQWLATHEYLKPTDKVGVIYHDIPTIAPTMEQTYLPELRARGINPVVVKLSSDNAGGLQQLTQAVRTLSDAGVTFVIPVMNLIYKSQFQKNADNQLYYPRYDESDVYFGCSDFTTAAYSQSQFQGTRCLTSTDQDQFYRAADKPTEWTTYADDVYNRSTPGGYAAGGASQDAANNQKILNYEIGTEFMLWYHAAVRAGSNLTRQVWGQAMQQTGPVSQQLGFCSMSFGPVKFDGSDALSVSEYHYEASNGYKAKTYHNVKACFANSY